MINQVGCRFDYCSLQLHGSCVQLFSLFFNICSGQVALNSHTFQFFPIKFLRYFVRQIVSGRAIKPRLHGFFGIGVLRHTLGNNDDVRSVPSGSTQPNVVP